MSRVVEHVPEGWQVARFADVADYTLGRTPPRKSQQYWADGDGIPWVTIADMPSFSMVNSTPEQVSQAAAREVFQGEPAPKGTLLMSFKLTIGRTAVLGIDAYHNEAIIAIRPKPGIERDFLRFYLPTIDFSAHQDRAVKGQTLNRGKLDVLPVLVPPALEQRAIANALRLAHSRIDLQARIVIALKALKASAMARLFDGSHPHRRLVELAKVSTGTTPPTGRTDYYIGEIPFVKTNQIADGVIVSAEQHISSQAVRECGLRVYPPGTVLLAMYGQGKTRGRAALLGVPATTTQNTAAIEPGPNLDGTFLWHYLLSQYESLRAMGNLGHLSHLNLGYVKAFEVPVLGLEEQRALGARLSALHNRIEVAEKKRAELGSLFSALLIHVMRGQLRMQFNDAKETVAVFGE